MVPCPGPDATLEQRVAGIEQLLDDVEDHVCQLDDSVKQESADRAGRDAAAEERLASIEENLKKQIKDLAVGGIQLQWVGLWWLVGGVVFSTWSQEIGRIVTSVCAGLNLSALSRRWRTVARWQARMQLVNGFQPTFSASALVWSD